MVKKKIALLKLAETLGSVALACRLMGYSRDSFYRFKRIYEEGGEGALRKTSRHKPCLKNRVNPAVENAVIAFAFELPRYGQTRVARELKGRGIQVSAGGVRSIWLRHDLETLGKRTRAIELRLASDGIKLSSDQHEMQAKSLLEEVTVEQVNQYKLAKV